MTDLFASAVARGLSSLNPPPRLLLAVSGGADSVALLDALWSGRARSDLKDLTFVVGHFDHGLRPDSHEDAALVERLAGERALRFVSRRERVDVPSGASLEEMAREYRYRALTSMAEEAACAAVVTAHTATDQAETLLWRLVRGTGRRGLGGMRADRPLGRLRLLRPMLRTTREDARSYCERRDLPFRDDPSNLDERPRARLRAEVLPVLERLQPGATLRIAQAAGLLAEEDELLDASVGEETHEVSALARLPAPLRRRALLRWAESALGTRLRLSMAHVDSLERLVLDRRGEVELPADALTHRVARISDGFLVLTERARVRQ